MLEFEERLQAYDGGQLTDVPGFCQLVVELSGTATAKSASDSRQDVMDALFASQFGLDNCPRQDCGSAGQDFDMRSASSGQEQHFMHPLMARDLMAAPMTNNEFALQSSGKKMRRKGMPLWKKRAIEAQMYPSELLTDISGTTSYKVKSMSPAERDLVLYKRKLRNRESARRSRERRKLLEQLEFTLFDSPNIPTSF